MAIKTLRLLLCFDENTRKQLWDLSVRHTLLINQLLVELPKQSKFESWRKKGSIPRKEIQLQLTHLKNKKFVHLKEEGVFEDIPARMLTSAVLSVQYMFASIFARQRKLHFQCEGKKTWLAIQEYDLDLAQSTDFTPEQIRDRAKQFLEEVEQRRQELREENQAEQDLPSVMSLLFQLFKETETPLEQRAIAYLLRNDCKVKVKKKKKKEGGEVEEAEVEDRDAILLRLSKKRIQIQRFEEQMAVELPIGRDPLGYRTDQLIQSAALFYPEGEFEAWQKEFAVRLANLSSDLETLPYPVLFGSNTDLYWSFETNTQPEEPKTSLCEIVNPNGTPSSRRKPKRRRYKKRKKLNTARICVRFKGFSGIQGKTYCDRRDLATLRQWVTDLEENKRRSKEDKFSLALLPLRSACLLWEPDKQHAGEEKPWQSHRLYLHCTIDTRLLTAEGTEQVRQEKLTKVNRYLRQLRIEEQADEILSCSPPPIDDEDEEQVVIENEENTQINKKNRTTRDRLIRNSPPPRPSQVAHRGDPDIAMKIAFSRQEIVGTAVMDLQSQQVLEYCTPRELLSEQRQEVLKQRSAKLHSQPKRQQKAQDKAEAVQQSEGKKSCSPYKPKINPKQLQLQPYRLINRWRRLRDQNIRDRQTEQQQGLYRPSKAEANLSQYLNRLLARRIIQRCQHWKVSIIVLPELGDLRESVESEIKAKAKQKFCDDNVYRQQQYKKEHRMGFHRWSYKNLSQCIRACAVEVGISVVPGRQPRLGTLQEKVIAVSSDRLPRPESVDSPAA
ncbi:type V CRISPR-associated protein Cas12k [Leptolyngbya ohadii]|uniref:type V CRISPR-associated protein Cas12k n=1 Tax=Leptolyngbya ohadii TaxID=1962290 RepID=UPI000B59F9B2|nr:type V CRISPR-associated protein Cas12k [Leptolyngbya ohadii]